jgi:predicted lipid-binding transport protein (Tim44 family)
MSERAVRRIAARGRWQGFLAGLVVGILIGGLAGVVTANRGAAVRPGITSSP